MSMASHGTVVSVSDLYGTMPVRRKVMLSKSWASHIQKIKYEVIPLLVGYSDITFTIYEMNKLVKSNILSVSGMAKESIRSGHIPREVQVLRAVYGSDIIPQWDDIEFKDGNKGLRVKGIISKHPVVVPPKTVQHILFNKGRFIDDDSSLANDVNGLIFRSGYYGENISDFRSNSRAAFIFSVSPLGNEYDKSLESDLKANGSLILSAVSSFLTVGGYNNKIERPLSKKRLNDNQTIRMTVSKKSKVDSIMSKENDGTFSMIDEELNQQQSELSSDCRDPPIPILTSTPETSKYFHPAICVESSNKKLLKEDISNCQVISQVDDKFIMIKMESDTGSSVLALIDQHAADERIILEELLAEAFSSQHEAIELRVPIQIVGLSDHDIEILPEYKLSFEQWGIKYNIIDRRLERHGSEVIATHLPSLLMDKCQDAGFIYRLIVNHVRDLFEMKASSAIWVSQRSDASTPLNWPVLSRCCPVAILDFLNTCACRSAIKFGQKLSLSECEEIVRSLSGCYFPFQCAHGRPTTVPLASISEPRF